MNSKERSHLTNLKNPCVDIDFLKATHGIAWPPDKQFEHDFRAWLATTTKRPCENGKLHRYAFEMFLQSQRLLTRKYSSARLGMKPESLDLLLPKLPQIGLSKRYAVYHRSIIDQSLSEDLVQSLPGLRFRTFGNHDSFCELLHSALRDTLKLDIKPLFCATADKLGEQRMYASTWDNITLQPLSIKHSVWLDFKKPLALDPDRCSKLLFAQNYDELKPYLAGREEPRDLSQYMDLVRRSP